MATAQQNLSEYDPKELPDAAGWKVGIAVSEWNRSITGNLMEGAKSVFLEAGVSEEDLFIEWVPGSFELPLGAQWLLQRDNLDAVVCLGSVIQGETRHFEFVCQAVAKGVQDVALRSGKPVIFGVLTDDTLQQAQDRSGGKHGNKGTEAAVAALKMAALKRRFSSPKSSVGFGK